MTGLLRLIRDHPDALEADLGDRHVDLRDYWRRGPDGRRLLTLRQIAVRVRHLPSDSAVARLLGSPGWTRADYLLADLVHVQTGKPHPARPKPEAAPETPERRTARRAALARAQQRRQDIEAGRIT